VFPDLIDKGFKIDEFANMRFNLTNVKFGKLHYNRDK
jgi:hypothetical protein